MDVVLGVDTDVGAVPSVRGEVVVVVVVRKLKMGSVLGMLNGGTTPEGAGGVLGEPLEVGGFGADRREA